MGRDQFISKVKALKGLSVTDESASLLQERVSGILSTEISWMMTQLRELSIAVKVAEDAAQMAFLNDGNPEVDRPAYLERLFKAENVLLEARNKLASYENSMDYLRSRYREVGMIE